MKLTDIKFISEISLGQVAQVITVAGLGVGMWYGLVARVDKMENNYAMRLEMEKDWRTDVKQFMNLTQSKLEGIDNRIGVVQTDVTRLKAFSEVPRNK